MHHKTLTILVTLLLVNTVSATKMSFGDVFIECDSDASWMECGSLLFVPNLHIRAFWTLVMGNIFQVFNVTEYLTLKAPQLFVDNLWGVISGIGVYLIILTLEFLKDYCILGCVFVCWSVLGSYVGIEKSIDPVNVAIWTGVLMVVGTIVLLMYNWGSAISMIGGA